MNRVSAAACAAFALHQVAIRWGVQVSLFDSFLDPLCLVPVVLGIPSMLARNVHPSYVLPWSWVAAATAVMAWAFEWWIPTFDPRFTADPWDALAYALGAFVWRAAEPPGR